MPGFQPTTGQFASIDKGVLREKIEKKVDFWHTFQYKV